MKTFRPNCVQTLHHFLLGNWWKYFLPGFHCIPNANGWIPWSAKPRKKLRVGGPTKIPQLWEVLLMLQKFGKPPPVGCKKNLVNTRDELPSKIFVQQYLWGEVFNLTLFGWLSTKSMVRISKQPSEKSEFWYKQTTIPHQHEGYVSIQQPGKIWKVKAMKGFILFMEEIRLSTWDVRNPLKGQFAYQLVYDFFIQPMIHDV